MTGKFMTGWNRLEPLKKQYIYLEGLLCKFSLLFFFFCIFMALLKQQKFEVKEAYANCLILIFN